MASKKRKAEKKAEPLSGWKKAVADEWESRHGGKDLESKFEDNFKYPLIARAFGTEEVVAMFESIMTGQLTMSHQVFEMEKVFAEYMGVPYAVMVNSGSSANLLALAVATNPGRTGKQLPKGSECLCPAVCWSTSLWPIIQLGLTPVLVDVDPVTLNMDVADMQRKITPRTSSVLLVHVLGNMGNMDGIMSVVKAQKLCLIEDTCESLGAEYKGTKLGAFGDFGTFSFYFSHHITTGEGGMVICKTLQDYDLCRCLRAHGWSRELSNKKALEARYSHLDARFLFVNLGYNLRPMEISGAIGIKQMEKLPSMNKIRNENHDKIEKALKSSPKFDGQFDFIQTEKGAAPAWFGFSCMINSRFGHQQPKFLEYMTEHGIENRPIISGNFARQPGLELLDLKILPEDFPGAEAIASRGFFFGVHTRPLRDEQVKYLVDTILNFPWNAKDVILVTGGSGLAGQALQQYVKENEKPNEEWVFLSSKDCDLTDLDATRAVFRQRHPTHVVHLAVLLMDGQKMKDHKVELWETNSKINENVLKVCREYHVQKVVSCLSSFAYPAKLLDGANPESHMHQGQPNASCETYAYAKRMLDVLSRCYREQYGCNFVTVLPTNIFGPFGTLRASGPVVEGLIARTLDSMKSGKPLQLFGTGKPKRQFLYSKDLAKLLCWALREYNEAEPINLVGEEIAIEEVTKLVTEGLHFKGKTVSDTSRPDGPLTTTIDGSKLAKLYPTFKRTPFKQALKETLDWHVAQQSAAANHK